MDPLFGFAVLIWTLCVLIWVEGTSTKNAVRGLESRMRQTADELARTRKHFDTLAKQLVEHGQQHKDEQTGPQVEDGDDHVGASPGSTKHIPAELCGIYRYSILGETARNRGLETEGMLWDTQWRCNEPREVLTSDDPDAPTVRGDFCEVHSIAWNNYHSMGTGA